SIRENLGGKFSGDPDRTGDVGPGQAALGAARRRRSFPATSSCRGRHRALWGLETILSEMGLSSNSVLGGKSGCWLSTVWRRTTPPVWDLYASVGSTGPPKSHPPGICLQAPHWF